MASFWTDYGLPGLTTIVEIVGLVLVLMVSMAYLTYAERKVLAAAQLRKGPNVVGPFGLLQPIADGLKLLTKETVIPSGANPVVFVMAPFARAAAASAQAAIVGEARLIGSVR